MGMETEQAELARTDADEGAFDLVEHLEAAILAEVHERRLERRGPHRIGRRDGDAITPVLSRRAGSPQRSSERDESPHETTPDTRIAFGSRCQVAVAQVERHPRR